MHDSIGTSILFLILLHSCLLYYQHLFPLPLRNSIGTNLKLLVERSDGEYCFRLHRDRVYYVREDVMLKSTNVARDHLIACGTCIGKFTGSGKFRMTVTALDLLSQYAKSKIWIKPNAEQSFLYGNHVTKTGLGRITENTERYGLLVGVGYMQSCSQGYDTSHELR